MLILFLELRSCHELLEMALDSWDGVTASIISFIAWLMLYSAIPCLFIAWLMLYSAIPCLFIAWLMLYSAIPCLFIAWLMLYSAIPCLFIAWLMLYSAIPCLFIAWLMFYSAIPCLFIAWLMFYSAIPCLSSSSVILPCKATFSSFNFACNLSVFLKAATVFSWTLLETFGLGHLITITGCFAAFASSNFLFHFAINLSIMKVVILAK